MKYNEKQIEEMAIKLYDIADKRDLMLTPNPYSLVGWARIAKEVLKHYQPKLPEDSVVNTPTIQCETYSNGDMVVISREKYEELKQTKSLLEFREETIKYLEDANIRYAEELENPRKEIAKEFYDKVNENICVFKLENKNQEYVDGYTQAIADICGRLDQVAKDYDIEIKE